MKIRVVDFETSDLPPEGAICQVGQCDVIVADGKITVGMPSAMFVKPGKPITAAARAAHHIRDKDLENAAPVELGLAQLFDGAPDIFSAHNAAFERQLFNSLALPWICTRKVGMRVWPDAPNFQNQVLRYHLGIDDDEGFEAWQAMPPHRAGPDCYVTAHLLKRALYKATADEMVAWTNQPSLLPGAIQFGKHKGTPWPQVDMSYLDWIVKQVDMDEDVKFTARHWLARRRSDAR